MGFFFFFQAEDGIRDYKVTGVQTCALPICACVTAKTRTNFRRRAVASAKRTRCVPSPLPRNSRATASERISASSAPYGDRKSTRLNSSHLVISYAVFCLKKKKK